MRQGQHHAAPKSTNTGLSLFNTTSSKEASVISSAIFKKLGDKVSYYFGGICLGKT